jgi:monoamine oxidase
MPTSRDTPNDVLVVGAGFAGLAAALLVHDAGLRVCVLEARERVGGRVWSSELDNGAVIELGAEWIFPGFEVLRELAARFDLPLVDTGVDYALREGVGPNGASVEAQQALLGAARARLAQVEPAALAAGTVGPFLDGLGAAPDALATTRARFEGTCALDLDRVSLAMAAEEDLFATGPAGPCARIAGGNQTLAFAMADALPDVRLGRVVDGIEASATGVTVRLGSARLDAAVLVLAVPAPIAARMPVTPAFPPALAETLRELPMGVAAKLAVATRRRPSARARQSAEVATWSWAADGEDGTPRACVTAFAGGHRAIAALGLDRGLVAPWFDLVRAMHPDLRLRGRPVVYVWGDDPFALGSYAAWDPASHPRAGRLREPVGRVVLAGEHTAAEGFHGTMEGALRSGRRAAAQALAALG